MDDWGRFVAQYYGQTHSGKSRYRGPEHARRGGRHRGQPYLQRRQARRLDHWGWSTPPTTSISCLGSKEVKFDWPKFSWIGSPERIDQVLFIRTDVPLQDPGRSAHRYRSAAVRGIGTGRIGLSVAESCSRRGSALKLHMVLGYGGGGEMNLAIEKGEVQCRAGTVSAYVGREPTRTWIKNGFVRALAQSGAKRYPKLPDVPTVYELMEAYKTPDATKRLAKVHALLRRSRAGPLSLRRQCPAERVKVLRAGLQQGHE